MLGLRSINTKASLPSCSTAFSLLVLTERPRPTRLFLKKSRTSLPFPVQSRSENALVIGRAISRPVFQRNRDDLVSLRHRRRRQRLFSRSQPETDLTILLLHGSPPSSRMFRSLIPALSGRYGPALGDSLEGEFGTKPRGHSYQVRERLSFHLSHHVAPVCLYRDTGPASSAPTSLFKSPDTTKAMTCRSRWLSDA